MTPLRMDSLAISERKHPHDQAYEAYVLVKLLRGNLQGMGGETAESITLSGSDLDALMSGLFMLEERVEGFYRSI